jgi:hypothetical protein
MSSFESRRPSFTRSVLIRRFACTSTLGPTLTSHLTPLSRSDRATRNMGL